MKSVREQFEEWFQAAVDRGDMLEASRLLTHMHPKTGFPPRWSEWVKLHERYGDSWQEAVGWDYAKQLLSDLVTAPE